MKLFKATNSVFQPILKRHFGVERLEKNLEDWLGANPQLLGDDILLVGRQVRTAHGIIDLLALDSKGNAVVIELKRGRAPREVIGQLNSYLTIVRRWSDSEMQRNSNLIPYDREVSNLVRRFKDHFKVSRAPDFNQGQIGIVVAEEFEPDFVPQIGGLRFDCRVIQFSNFVTQADGEFLLINTLHDSMETARTGAEHETSLPDVSPDVKERFGRLLDEVYGLLKKDTCRDEDGWRLHRSGKYVQGVFSCWQKAYEGITIYLEPDDGKCYVSTNCLPEHNRLLSSLLKKDKPRIEAALGGGLIWDMESWWALSEEVDGEDAARIAGRITEYIRHLKPYLDQALPARSSRNGSKSVTQLQLDFWTGFHKHAKDSGTSLRLPSPRPKGFMYTSVSGFLFVAIATQRRMTVYVAIKGADRKKNFEALKAEKASIEREFGGPLEWAPLPHRDESQVQVHWKNGSLDDPSTWPATYKWMLESLERFHAVFVPHIKHLKLRSR